MMNKDANLHRPSGSLAAGRFSVDLDQAAAGWTWTSLRVLNLGPGDSQALETGPCEMLVLPLAASCTVSCGGQRLDLAGRTSVLEGLSDFAYLPRRTRAEITSTAGGRFALPGAVAGKDLPVRYGPAGDVGVELRGTGPGGGDDRLTGGVRNEMHMKFVQNPVQSWDRIVDKTKLSHGLFKPCTFIQSIAMFCSKLYRFGRTWH